LPKSRIQNLAERIARLALSEPGLSGTPTPNSSQAPDARTVLAETENSMRAVLSEAVKGYKQPTRQAQSTQLLESLSSRIQTAIASLQSASAPEEIDALWEKADHAKRELAIVANSLKPLKESPERDSVVNEMRKLECDLNEFITTLPKDRRPLYYDSGKDIGFLHHLKR
jgi:predicted  nucleic acid-binding Zn-ribbon protein